MPHPSPPQHERDAPQAPGLAARAGALWVGAALALLLAEGLLRLAGLGPWAPVGHLSALPQLSDADPELGWVNRPGTYTPRPGGQTGPTIEVGIGDDGSRAGPPRCEGEGLWLMGGSFVFGFGVNDDETLAAQLFARAPGSCITSWAVPGYGTVQSRALYQRLSQAHRAPHLIVYGLVDLHEGRNVAAPSWLYALDRAAGANSWVAVPSARWRDGALRFAPPAAWKHSRLSERSAVANLVERAAVAAGDMGTTTKTRTTLELIDTWSKEAAQRGDRLVVALLHAPERRLAYVLGLQARGVQLVDLTGVGGFPGDGWQVPGDGHPNGRAYAAWAEALAPLAGSIPLGAALKPL